MLDFPNSPSVGQVFPSPAISGVPIWRWDGNEWVSASTPLSAAGVEGNYSFTVTAASGSLSVLLTDMLGNPLSSSSAALFYFNTSSSILVPITVAAPTSISIPSGATLGQPSAKAFRIWVVGFNDAGTFRLGLICCSDATNQIYPLQEHLPMNSTLISGSSNSAGVIYTGAAVAGKYFRILGFIEWGSGGIATAGTWTVTNLLYVQKFGAGIRKPGYQVNGMLTQLTGRSAGVTATTYTNTNQTASYTPTSAANIVKVSVMTGMQMSTANCDAWARLYNGTAQVGSEFEGFMGSGVTQGSMAVPIIGYDKPNTLSPVTYTMQARVNSGSYTVFIGSTSLSNPGAQFIFEELVT
jgi:hypothetical protein